MKYTTILFVLLIVFCFPATNLRAQSDENRNTLTMNINYGGKTIVTPLSSLNTTLSRYSDDNYLTVTKDTASGKKEKGEEKHSTVYLSMVVKKINPDLLAVFAKRQTRFDGTITIKDTYGKNPDTVIKFSGGALESYSDQFSGISYSDSYSGANVSLSCKLITINGVELEN